MKKIIMVSALLFCSLFALAQPPCSDFDNPPGCQLCQLSYYGSTEGFSPDAIAYDFECGTIENSQWHSITADASKTIHVTISSVVCNFGKGVEGRIYDANYQPVSDCFSADEFGNGYATVSNAIPNEPYLILLDGVDGDFCDFFIQISGAKDFSKNIPSIPNRLSPVFAQCGDTDCFSITPDKFVESIYEWTIPEFTEIVSGGGLLDTFVCLKYVAGGIPSSLIVTPSTSCGQTVGFIRTIASRLDFAMIIDTVICPGSCVIFGNDCLTQSENINLLTPCGRIERVNISFADVGDFEIKCLIDTFTNSAAFNWKNLGADSFEIFINDVFHIKKAGSSFLMPLSSTSGDSLKLRVVPSSILGCAFQSSEVVCPLPRNTSDTHETDFSTFKIFPNPTSGIIEIISEIPIEKVSVFDLSGKLILEDFDKKIDLSEHNSGLYIFKINSDGGSFVKKVLKQN